MCVRSSSPHVCRPCIRTYVCVFVWEFPSDPDTGGELKRRDGMKSTGSADYHTNANKLPRLAEFIRHGGLVAAHWLDGCRVLGQFGGAPQATRCPWRTCNMDGREWFPGASSFATAGVDRLIRNQWNLLHVLGRFHFEKLTSSPKSYCYNFSLVIHHLFKYYPLQRTYS